MSRQTTGPAYATALAERQDLPVGEYLERLRKTRGRLEGVEASLCLSYALLSEELQQRWRILAVFPGTFESPGAAAVWATPLKTCQVLTPDLY